MKTFQDFLEEHNLALTVNIGKEQATDLTKGTTRSSGYFVEVSITQHYQVVSVALYGDEDAEGGQAKMILRFSSMPVANDIEKSVDKFCLFLKGGVLNKHLYSRMELDGHKVPDDIEVAFQIPTDRYEALADNFKIL